MVSADQYQEGPNEPQAQCPSCKGIMSLRWFQQTTYEPFIEVDGIRYGQPCSVCRSCYRGQLRGPKAAQIGRLYSPDIPEPPRVASWVREQRLREFFDLD